MSDVPNNQWEEISFLEKLYELYQSSPNQVDPAWKNFFRSLEGSQPKPASASSSKQTVESLQNQSERIQRLIDTYRRFGHLIAKVNSIELKDRVTPTQLKLDWIGFKEEELSQSFPTLGLLPQTHASLKEIIQALQKIYCDRIGFEFKDTDPELEQWIQQRIESPNFQKELTDSQRLLLLNSLNRSELFETFLHTKYIGQKRFSLEGTETLIPMLALLLEEGAEMGLQEVVVGMAHRGRLNVLANILNKSYDAILAEFDESYVPAPSEGMGDVKYHKGYSGEYTNTKGHKVAISLPPNPSHLESIYPVVEGQVRAKQFLTNDQRRTHILPILLHGDAALSGQGVVYETLQFSQLPGYKTGGTLHLVINNQIGFTTIPRDLRSTFYCSAIARAFEAPVFHVNAEDPEGCVHIALLALEIRQRFHCDVFIDINGYRKYGHNEGDEPAFTQPLEYQIIRKKRSIRQLYHDYLLEQNLVQKEIIDEMENEFKKKLQEAYVKAHEENKSIDAENERLPRKEALALQSIETGVPQDILEQIAERFSQIPEGFQIHPKVGSLVKDRLKAIKEDKPIDWGLAEHLAFATLLWEGVPVRLSGQDSGRGTFSQRHALWVDQTREKDYYPLNHLKEGQGHFEVYNSSLSEMGVLGFEYGYSVSCPHGLTIWEAQYGDFNNGAQIIIDQYLSSGEEKWGQKSGLVLFLPHGYEGQGPEHSSGRLERFLTLVGNHNLTIANLTTPAQFFHLLRRQLKANILKPLVVFTPKGLLRLPACTSRIKEFVNGSFQPVLDDEIDPQSVKRVIFCSGHVYYDLIAKRSKENLTGYAIVRIEQLNPLDEETLKALIKKYNQAKDYFWVQEEPQNMGAWLFMQSRLLKLLPPSTLLHYAGRKASGTPATGSRFYHEQEQANLLKQVFQT